MNNSLSLIARVRRAELNFERLVQILSTTGYLTEQHDEEGCNFISTAMESSNQEDFDALFGLLLPGRANEILISCAATDKGGPPGGFAYGLYNSNLIDREDMLRILMIENEDTARSLGLDI